MFGLVLLIVLAIWAAIAFVLIFVFTMKIKNKLRRWLLILSLSPLLFVAPMGDEIIGAVQFNEVCKEKKWVYDEAKVRNSEVRYGGQIIERIDDKFIPMEKLTYFYIDPVTDNVLISEIYFREGSGWLLRSISKTPKYPTKSTVCSPDEYQYIIFKRLNITEVKDKK